MFDENKPHLPDEPQNEPLNSVRELSAEPVSVAQEPAAAEAPQPQAEIQPPLGRVWQPTQQTMYQNAQQRVQRPPQVQQTQQQWISPPPIYPAQPPKAKKTKKRRGAALALLCLIGSAVFGFGGSMAANVYWDTVRETPSGTGTGRTAVVYQSVVKAESTADGSGLTVADVAATAKDSVVEITTESVTRGGFLGQYVTQGAGSGVVLTTDGFIVTNNHVIAGARSVTVRLSDGTAHEASLVGADEKTDLAVLKINKTGLQPAVMGNSASLVVGETAVAIGNPLGELGGTVTQGIISALDREITVNGESMSLLQTSTAINAGNSGGGLFNLNGELVGIVNAKSAGSEIEGLGFAIPVDTAKKVVEQLIEYGYVTGRIDTGLTLVDIQDAHTAMSYRVNKLGLYIAKSTHSAFQSGDIILAVNGENVANQADFDALTVGAAVGDTLQITVLRDDERQTFSLTLGEQKQSQ